MNPSSENLETESETTDERTCRPAFWFYRRMGMFILLTGGLGLYFLYDGAIGYPKKNFTVALYESFERGLYGKSFDETPSDDSPSDESDESDESDAPADEGEEAPPVEITEEKREELRAAHEAGADGSSWASFAADRLLPEEVPEPYTEAQIEEQFRFAAILGGVAIAMLIYCLWQRGRVYRFDDRRVRFPNGKERTLASATALDLRKWDRGIARVTFDADGRRETHRFDDYKYEGIDELVRRLYRGNPDIEILGDRKWVEKDDAKTQQG